MTRVNRQFWGPSSKTRRRAGFHPFQDGRPDLSVPDDELVGLGDRVIPTGAVWRKVGWVDG